MSSSTKSNPLVQSFESVLESRVGGVVINFVLIPLLILSALLGAINLSRAVSDPNLSREILHGVREELIGLVKPELHRVRGP